MNMTIEGDILSLKRGIILQQVNAQGVMGSGIALAIRNKYPVVWDAYSAEINPIINSKLLDGAYAHMGKLIMVPVGDTSELWVANIVGQCYYSKRGTPSGTQFTSYDALDEALTKLKEWNRDVRLPVHYPLIGAVRGGGSWPVIKALLDHHLRDFDRYLWLLPNTKEPS